MIDATAERGWVTLAGALIWGKANCLPPHANQERARSAWALLAGGAPLTIGIDPIPLGSPKARVHTRIYRLSAEKSCKLI